MGEYHFRFIEMFCSETQKFDPVPCSSLYEYLLFFLWKSVSLMIYHIDASTLVPAAVF